MTSLNHDLKASGGNFVMGDHYSMADAVCTASVFRMMQLKMDAKINALPRVSDWYQKMQQRPSFKTAILDLLPHSVEFKHYSFVTDK